MKRFGFPLLFLYFGLTAFSQTPPQVVCPYGFTSEISTQKNWGYGQPVVLTVTPNSPADAAGVRVNDIIETINDKSTAGENIGTIISWLQSSNDQIRLVTRNLGGTRQNKTLNKICRLNNLLTERDLARIYSFYSLEDVQTHAFTCPFKTIVSAQNDLLSFVSFGFAAPDSGNLSLENAINAAIRKCLEQRGLKYSEKNPDMIIHTHYSQASNPNFRNNPQADKFPVVYRYNVQTKSMEKLPIYYNSLIHPDQAKYFLKLGISLFDNKKKNSIPLWECEADELLQSNYSLADYAEFHVPLMFMQYPYPKSTESAAYYYGRSKFNYTGICYNMDNLKEIVDVDPSSPAAQAGIQAGDIVEKINGVKFNNNVKSADNNYKQFIYKTMLLRDPGTQFTNAEGFSRCMFWDKMKYGEIADQFKKPEFTTVFSYLFYFQPYINLSSTNIVSFNIIRGKDKEEIKIRPTIVSEEIFERR